MGLVVARSEAAAIGSVVALDDAVGQQGEPAPLVESAVGKRLERLVAQRARVPARGVEPKHGDVRRLVVVGVLAGMGVGTIGAATLASRSS